jgi:hypothetical protein
MTVLRTTTTTTTTTTIIPTVGVIVPLATRLGLSTLAIAHSLSTPIHLGGFSQHLFTINLTPHHPTSCSTLHFHCPHLFLATQPFLPLRALYTCGKNDPGFSCSHSSHASNNSLDHSLLNCASCESHLFSAYGS